MTPVPDAAFSAAGGLGMVGAWFDPSDPRIWSGMFRHVIDELTELGVFAGFRDVTPSRAPALLVHRWLSATGRATGSWTLRPEARLLCSLQGPWLRRRPPRHAAAWIVPQGTIGRPVRGPSIVWCDLSPAQLVAAGPEVAAGFGFPEVTARQLRAAASAQLGQHRRAVATCAVSQWTARSLVDDHQLPADRVHVVGCGRNVDVPPPAARDWSTPRFLFVGNDWTRKGGDRLVRCFLELRRRHPTAELDVAGVHPRLDAAGVTGHGPLRFDQPASRAKLERLFSAATCFVMPSRLEPFGIVHVEAAGAGVPSIGTSHGGTATSIGDGGLLVDPDDDGALLAAMDQMTDPAVARELGARALRRAALFTWRNVAERLLRACGLTAVGDRELAGFLDGTERPLPDPPTGLGSSLHPGGAAPPPARALP